MRNGGSMRFFITKMCGFGVALVFALAASAQINFENNKEQNAKSIYGQDNRQEPYEINDAKIAELSQATAAIFPVYKIMPLNRDYSKSSTQSVAQSKRLCRDEKFSDQPSSPYCSGVLISKDTILTAGHCVKLGALACWGINIVFDYRMDTPEQNPWRIANKNIYSCSKIISYSNKEGLDYAIIRLDRPVLDRKPVEVQTSRPAVQQGDQLIMMGHPLGMPQKIVTGGLVRKSLGANILTNLDSLSNNSGSPVFSNQHQLIGLLVSGESDLIYEKERLCKKIKRCEANSCKGETVQSIEPLLKFIHGAKAY